MKKLFYLLIFASYLLVACNLQPTKPTSSEQPIETQANFWQPLGNTLDANTNRDAYNPSLALDSSGNPVVSWNEDDGTSFNIYVKRWSGSSWVLLGSSLDANTNRDAYEPSLALDSSGNPVVSWNEDDGTSTNIYVKRWNGSNWVQLGTFLDTNTNQIAGSPSLALDSSGNPVVSWWESDGTSFNIYVKRYNSGTNSWDLVGTSFLDANTNLNAYASSLALNSSGNPVVSWFEDDGTSNNIYVKRWNGSNWVQLGSFLDANTNQIAGSPSLALDSSGNPVVSWYEDDGTSYNIYVKRWNGNSWVQLGSFLNANNAYAPSLALNSSGNPVVSWEEDDGTSNNIYVKRWNGSNWVQLGSFLDANTNLNAYAPSLALDSSGNPAVSWYEDDGTSDNIYVKHFVTNGWQPLASPLDNTITNPANYSSIARTSNNRPIVAWQENVSATDRDVFVKSWTGTSWTNLGRVDRVSTNPAKVPSIAVGTDNRPVVAWGETSFEGTYKYDIFVSRWNGSVWTPLGSRLSSVRSDEWPVIALDSANTPYVTWISDVNGFRGVYVKKWDGFSWVSVNGLPGFSKLNSASATYTTMIIDRNGNPVVAWAEYNTATNLYTIRVKQWNGVQWDTVRNISNASSYKISLAVSSNNTIYIAAAQNIPINGKTLSRLRVHYRSGGVNRTLGSYINENSNAYSPDIQIGGDDKPVVVWHEIPDSFLVSNNIAIKRWTGTAWESIGSAIEDYYFDTSSTADIILKTNNNPIISFTTNTGSGNLEDIMVKQY